MPNPASPVTSKQHNISLISVQTDPSILELAFVSRQPRVPLFALESSQAYQSRTLEGIQYPISDVIPFRNKLAIDDIFITYNQQDDREASARGS